MVYVNDVNDVPSDLPTGPYGEILGWLNRNKKSAPAGIERFGMVRGITARKFVEVQVNVFKNIEMVKEAFFQWLKTLKGFKSEWIDRGLYSFKSVGKWTKPT